MDTDNILTPLDPEWDNFTTALIRHLKACEKHDDWGDFDYLETSCEGTFKVSRNILENRYPHIDVEATIEYFRANEWFCDCDIFYECPCGLGNPKCVELKKEVD